MKNIFIILFLMSSCLLILVVLRPNLETSTIKSPNINPITEILNNQDFKKICLKEIQVALKAENAKNQLPISLANIIGFEWSSNTDDPINKRLNDSFLALQKLSIKTNKNQADVKLNAIYIHESEQVLILLSLEEMKSKNRIWELGITIKKNPTKSL